MEELSETTGSKNAITLRNLPAGQKLIHQDEKSRSVYVIKSGVVKCYITEENEKDYILEFLGEGEALGEIEAIRSLRAISTVEAITPLSLYTMSSTQFLYFLRTMPDFNVLMMELLATRVVNSAIKGARQQLYARSHILPQLLSALESQGITFTKQDLSEYLGISLRSLNRLLKDLN